MLRFGVFLLFLFCVAPINGQGQPCRRRTGCYSCGSSTYGQQKLNVIKKQSVNTGCDFQYCFDNSARRITDAGARQTLETQNCQTLLRDNLLQSGNLCPTENFVVGYPCKMCSCTTQYDIQWKSLTRYGRFCRALSCQNVVTLNGNSSCGVNAQGEDWKYVPGSVGFIRAPTQDGSATGRIANRDVVSEFSEFDTFMGSGYQCPPTFAGKMCNNNPDMSLNGTIASTFGTFYQEGSLYFSAQGGLSNATSCQVYNCSAGTWGNPMVNFVDNTVVTGAELAFVQSQCPVSFIKGDNLDLAPCISSTSSIPMYFRMVVDNCGGAGRRSGSSYITNSLNINTRSTFCGQFKCGCPANKPTPPAEWYINRKEARGRPSGSSIVVQPFWTGFKYYCARYQCIVRGTNYANVSSFQAFEQQSNYGNIDPCDFNLGYNAVVGKYWSGTTLTRYSLYTRSSAFGNGPTGGFTGPMQVSNATCMALQLQSGSSSPNTPCYEVKAYTRPDYTLVGSGCPVGESLSENCPATSNECQVTTNQRPPVNGYIPINSNGAFIGHKLQCFADGENLAQETYCQRNDQMQNAYENVDRCINNANFKWNLEPKAASAGTCASGFRTVQLNKGACDHPIFRNYLQHVTDCYCAFVRQKTAGTSNFAGKEQSILVDFYGAEGSLGLNTEWISMVGTLQTYGCTFSPVVCTASGKASMTVSRPTISGTMRVGNACEFTNIPSVRASLQTYFGTASPVTTSNSYFTSQLLFSNVRDVGSECHLDFKVYVRNSVWANYLVNNLTANGNGGPLYESLTVTVGNEFTTVPGRANHVGVSLAALLAVVLAAIC